MNSLFLLSTIVGDIVASLMINPTGDESGDSMTGAYLAKRSVSTPVIRAALYDTFNNDRANRPKS